MGLFDKKICDICGEKIGLLGNRKLDDGNLCKDCAKKLSPWFEDRRHSTVEDIKRQLEYREKNKKAVMDFCITRQINTRNYNVFISQIHIQLLHKKITRVIVRQHEVRAISHAPCCIGILFFVFENTPAHVPV